VPGCTGGGGRRFLVVDLPFEERGEALPAIRKAGLDWIPLAAPTSGMARVRRWTARAPGSCNLISVTGITGVRKALPAEGRVVDPEGRGGDAAAGGRRIRISSPAMAAAATRHADAAVVGSACVKIVERYGRGSRGPAELSRFVRSLKKALR